MIRNYFNIHYNNDDYILNNFGFQKKDNLGRLISLINLPLSFAQMIGSVSLGLGLTSLFLLYKIMSISISAFQEQETKEIKLTMAFDSSFKKRMVEIKPDEQDKLDFSTLLTCLWEKTAAKISYVVTNLIGVFFPEIGRKGRIIKRYEDEVVFSYEVIQSPRFEKVAEEAFSTLGLNKEASDEEIRNAFKVLRFKSHPDKNCDPSKIIDQSQLKQVKLIALVYKRKNQPFKCLFFLLSHFLTQNPTPIIEGSLADLINKKSSFYPIRLLKETLYNHPLRLLP